MKNIFEPHAIHAFSSRIEKLTADTRPQWGKMNAFQMLKHCAESTKCSLGLRNDKRSLLSYLFGRMILKKIIKDDSPPARNTPTAPAFVVKEDGDFQAQKQILLSLLQQYSTQDKTAFDGRVHPFFGKMTAMEYGILDYKHLDHHLRQFGV